MVDLATARQNIVDQIVDGSPNTITPSKMRQLLTDFLDAVSDNIQPFSKLDATSAPTVNDDGADTSGNGVFLVTSKWYDQTNDEAYECLDNTTGAAVWVPSSIDASDLGTAAVLDVGTSANNIVQLDGSGNLPAVNGSALTNLPSSGGDLVSANNLSDLDNAGTARTNLGLGGLAELNTVSASEIDAGAVTTAKILNDNVTADKLADTAVTAGSYTNADITVDAQGRITAAADGGSAAPGILHVRDEKADGTTGGNSSSGSWNARDLGTIVQNTIPGASGGAANFVLPEGTYIIRGRAPFYSSSVSVIRLYNTTDSVEIERGGNVDSRSPQLATGMAEVVTSITLAGTKTIELQYQVSAGATNGLGRETSFTGIVEVYAEVFIEKVA